MARGSMTRSSIASAIVVTLLLGLLLWLPDDKPHVQRVTAALSQRSNASARATREVVAVPAARRVSPEVKPSISVDVDAGAPSSR